jgi:type I restriction enzyme, S subunit
VIRRFVYYWAKQLKPWLTENASATTITIINKGRFEKAPIVVPSLEEQHRIVTKLDVLYAHSKSAREESARIPRLIERYKLAILATAFRGELSADWRARNKIAFDSSWCETSLGDLCIDVRYGTAAKCHYEPRDTPVLRIPNVVKGRIDTSDLKYGRFTEQKFRNLLSEAPIC